jgi:hypothetical protein
VTWRDMAERDMAASPEGGNPEKGIPHVSVQEGGMVLLQNHKWSAP